MIIFDFHFQRYQNQIKSAFIKKIVSIYDEIRVHNLAYIDVNEPIRKLWRKTILKSARDPGANFNTFLRKNEEIINNILLNTTLDIHARE